MFYDIYCELCKGRKISASAAAIEMGINKGTVSVWKNKRTTPQTPQLQKIAEYFDVSTDYLLGNEKKTALDNESEPYKDELIAFYGAVKNELTEDDLADIKTLMRLRAEMRREKKGK